jgi:hypothetical protein
MLLITIISLFVVAGAAVLGIAWHALYGKPTDQPEPMVGEWTAADWVRICGELQKSDF